MDFHVLLETQRPKGILALYCDGAYNIIVRPAVVRVVNPASITSRLWIPIIQSIPTPTAPRAAPKNQNV